MKKAKRVSALILILILQGCAAHSGIKSDINVKTAAYLNPDINGHPSPVVLTIYELKSQQYFNQATYNQLATEPTNTLKTSLIDLHPFEIQPNYNFNDTLYLNNNIHYIGVTAAYRNIDSALWKKLLPLPHNTKKIKLLINLESENLLAKINN